MARNEVFHLAQHVSLPVGAGIKSGDPVRVGSLNGVAQTDAEPNTNGITTSNSDGYASVWSFGAHRVPVTLAAAGAIGDPVYATVDGANALATLTGTAGGALFGVLLENSDAGDDLLLAVKLVDISA